jgi:hypothetical protein
MNKLALARRLIAEIAQRLAAAAIRIRSVAP